MVKVRLQGTKQDINWFIERVLKNNNQYQSGSRTCPLGRKSTFGRQ